MRLRVVALAACCAALWSVRAAEARVLGVTTETQQQTEWCWAGVSRSVLRYYGHDVAQCAIAEYARTHATVTNYGATNCCADPSQGCNQINYLWGCPESIASIIAVYGVSSGTLTRALTLTEIQYWLANDYPFFIFWAWTLGGGHFVVGYGEDGGQLYYMDPWPGEGAKIATYNWVKGNFWHSWDNSLTTSGLGPCIRLPDGTSCDVGAACTVDTCHGGACFEGGPVVCAPEPCHTAPVCNPATNACAATPLADGTPCNDGNACTQIDGCVAGTCTGTGAVTCAAPDACRAEGVCNPATGACSFAPLADGTPCDDGNACTRVDGCVAGSCTGTDAVICAASEVCHAEGACDPATGTCSFAPLADGTPCDDGNGCTHVDGCVAGSCTGTDAVICAPPDACHAEGVCDPATGACSFASLIDGTLCNDGNACTQVDGCVAGSCTGTDAVICAPADACHAEGVCDPATGTCSFAPLVDGTPCDDGNACTQSDGCVAGSCIGTDAVVCAPSDACYAGVCDPATGTCGSEPVADGTPCAGGTCQNGSCKSHVSSGCACESAVGRAPTVPGGLACAVALVMALLVGRRSRRIHGPRDAGADRHRAA